MERGNSGRTTILMWGSVTFVDLLGVSLIWVNDPSLTKGMMFGGVNSEIVTALGAVLAAVSVPVLASSSVTLQWRRVLRLVVNATAITVGLIGLDSALTSSNGPWLLAVFGAFGLFMVARSRVASSNSTYTGST